MQVFFAFNRLQEKLQSKASISTGSHFISHLIIDYGQLELRVLREIKGKHPIFIEEWVMIV